MADDLQYSSSRPENKRKYEERTTPPPPPTASSGPRRTTGFSAPITSHSPDSNPPPSYNSVPPPMDEIQIAKQRAQEIAARLFSNAEAKRPRLENGGPNEDSNDTKGFSSSAPSDLGQKALGHQYGQGGVGASSMPAAAGYGFQGTSKKIEIPNGRVGVIIGKSGETIKYLQVQSGAKIQVTRDVDADLTSPTRMVELMGTPEQISKAEQLINGVIAQAEAGGSNLVSRRFSGQTGGEQFQMKVPNNKVGLIIGKGGETIKNMQATSGARIQLIPLHLPPGDVSTERTVYIDGTSEQIEAAKQLVNEVISENRLRNPVMSGGYNQQGYRPPQPPSWGPPGPPPMQQTSYGYMQPGAYPGPPPQYNMSQPQYAGYPPQTTSSGWDQTGAPPSQQTTPGSGYDYYSQQTTLQQQAPHGGTSTPAENAGYNYNKPAAAPYNQQQGSYGTSSYSQPPGGPQQSYPQDGYGGGFHTSASQPGYGQSQTNIQPGYDQSQGYNAAPSYGTGVAPAQDGAATAYGAQGGSSQIPPSQQVPTSIQPSPATQQGYTSQQPNTPPSYTAQGSQAGYPATSQPGYGSQPPAQTGYGQSVPLTQPGYGLPQGQKPPGQTSYGQTQPPSSQGGYVQPSSVQSGYAHSQSLPTQSLAAQPDSSHRPPPSGFGSGTPPAGYAQQPYGVPQAAAQPGYSQQQQQPYGDSYAGGYSQPPGYSNDSNVSGSVHGSYEAAAGAQPVQQSGVAKASPQS